MSFGVSKEYCGSGGVEENEVSELSCVWFLESLWIPYLAEMGTHQKKLFTFSSSDASDILKHHRYIDYVHFLLDIYKKTFVDFQAQGYISFVYGCS